MRQIITHLFIVSILLVEFAGNVLAQNIVESDEWPITERCVGELPYPTIPRDRWDFDGIIVSQNRDGIRAIRTDFDTSYFIALSSGNSFPSAGQFSPNGRWFAYPLGETRYMSMSWNSADIDRLRVISTGPDGTYYDMPWFNPLNNSVSIDRLQWVDNETLITFGRPSLESKPSDSHVWFVNIFTQEFEPVPTDFDMTAMHSRRFVATPPVTGVVFQKVSGEGLFFKELDGVQTLIFSSDTSQITDPVISPNKRFAYFHAGYELYLIDIDKHQISHICQMSQPGWVRFYFWSPNSQYLAFALDGYPILLNIETLEMQILRYETGQIIAWLPG